jgi:hypothetical protein
MIRLVDTVEVQPHDLEAYLAAFAEYYLPGALDRGVTFVGCWHTPTEIGENISVVVVFELESWEHWERVRNAGVRDPLMPTWIERRRELMLRGTRRFYEDAHLTS